MRSRSDVPAGRAWLGLVVGVWLGVTAGASASRSQKPAPVPSWRTSFPTEGLSLKTVGENPYFILKQGYQLTLRDKNAKNPIVLVITVLDETRNMGGIDARVVEERESTGGELTEISRNYFAIDDRTRDVYYLGEDVDTYKKGRVVNHEGSWHHGERGAHLGLMMPGAPAVGMRYYQEQAKGVAMDRAEVAALNAPLTTPAGTFTACLRIKETSPLEPLLREYKTYAPGVGLIKDGDLELVSRTQ